MVPFLSTTVSSISVKPFVLLGILETFYLSAYAFTTPFAYPPSESSLRVASSSSPIVKTTSGPILGFLDSTTTSTPLLKYYGIRYASTTSGPNRWTPPKPYYDPDIFNASAFGPACMQGRADGGAGTSVQSEDCLRVNAVVPVLDQSSLSIEAEGEGNGLPVYIYAYGGGFDSGSTSDLKIDGSFLAAKGLIFVSFNYRLSLFAYPHATDPELAARETQNFGLLDTRVAVEWVRDNIRAFGGDTGKITLGGESVGAEMTNLYMSAWPEDPIVRAAIMQSSDTSQPQWEPNSQLTPISTHFSCPSGKGELDCLRNQSAFDLQKILLETGTQFQPIIDNITIFKDYVKQTKEGKTAKIPLLVGTNKDEGTLIFVGEPSAYNNLSAYILSNNLNFPFASLPLIEKLYPVPSRAYPTIYNATSAIWRDAHMLCLASNLAKWRTLALGLKVWRYRFDLVEGNLNSAGRKIGAFHGEDIRFVMGTTATIAQNPPYIPVTPFEQKVSDYMVTAWTNFIKDPHKGPQLPNWSQYDPADPTTLAILGIDPNGAIKGNHFEIDRSCEYWNTVLPLYPQTFPACGNWTC